MLLLCCFFAGGAGAQSNQTWIQPNVNNDWSLFIPNWDAGVPWTDGNNAIFGTAADNVQVEGAITVNNMTFSVGGYTIADADSDGTLTLLTGSSISTAAGTTTISENLEGGGSLTKIGSATAILNLSGQNTYTGATLVSLGVLQASSAGALQGTSGITVSSGAALALNDVSISGKSVTISGNGTDNLGALKATGTGISTWAGSITIAAAARIGVASTTGTLVIDGVIDSSSGTPGLAIRSNTGTNVVQLNKVNTYLGGTSVVVGTLKLGIHNALPISTLTMGNAASVASATFDLNGFNQQLTSLTNVGSNNVPTLVTNTSGTLSTLTMANAGTVVWAGPLGGNLALTKTGAGNFTLTAANTNTGPTHVVAGTLELSGANGALGSTTGVTLYGGTLSLNNSVAATNNNARLANGANLVFSGGSMTYLGSADAGVNSSETVGSLSVASGYQTLRISFGSTNAATVTATQLTRGATDHGVLLMNGVGLGKDSASTASVSRLLLSSPITPSILVGGSDALGTGIGTAKNTKIIPFLVGEATSTTGGIGTASGTPNTFVTYHETTGFRPLNLTDEFTQNSYVAGDNVRITAATPVNASVAVNSLVVGASITINSGFALTVTSGALLYGGGNTISGPGTLNFGAAEGVITTLTGGNATLSAAITGSGGLIIAGVGTYVPGSSASTYSGGTYLAGGTIVPTASSVGPAGAPTSGPFGTGTITLAGAQIRATTGSAITLANNVHFLADTIVPSNGQALTFTGAVTLMGQGSARTLTQNSSGTTEFAGAIGDGGLNYGITIAGSGGVVVFSGNNTYGGATTVNSGRTLQIGVNGTTGTFGTGSVVNNGSILIIRAGALSVANDISGAGQLSHNGNSTTTLSGVNTYAGTTSIAAGVVLVNGSHTGGDTYSVGGNTTLGGTGSITTKAGSSISIAASGTLSVGDGSLAAAALALTTSGGGALTFSDATSILRLDIASDASAGTGTDQSGDATRADQLVVSGTVNLNGARLILGTLPGVDSLLFVEGDRWDLFDWVTSIPVGTFTINPATDLPALSGDRTWDLSDLYAGGTITVLVPEPSRMALLLLAGVAVALRRRRHQVPAA